MVREPRTDTGAVPRRDGAVVARRVPIGGLRGRGIAPHRGADRLVDCAAAHSGRAREGRGPIELRVGRRYPGDLREAHETRPAASRRFAHFAASGQSAPSVASPSFACACLESF